MKNLLRFFSVTSAAVIAAVAIVVAGFFYACQQNDNPSTLKNSNIEPLVVTTGIANPITVANYHNNLLRYVGHHFNPTYLDSSTSSQLSRIEKLDVQYIVDTLELTDSISGVNSFISSYDSTLFWESSDTGYNFENMRANAILVGAMNLKEDSLYIMQLIYILQSSPNDSMLAVNLNNITTSWNNYSWNSNEGNISGYAIFVADSSYAFWHQFSSSANLTKSSIKIQVFGVDDAIVDADIGGALIGAVSSMWNDYSNGQSINWGNAAGQALIGGGIGSTIVGGGFTGAIGAVTNWLKGLF